MNSKSIILGNRTYILICLASQHHKTDYRSDNLTKAGIDSRACGRDGGRKGRAEGTASCSSADNLKFVKDQLIPSASGEEPIGNSEPSNKVRKLEPTPPMIPPSSKANMPKKAASSSDDSEREPPWLYK